MANSKTAVIFQALGDPTRREIFERLVKGPQAVVDLSAGLHVSRPAVSQHLKVLKDSGLVLLETRGTRHLYRVDPEGVTAMRDYLDRLWDAALTAFKAAAEKAQKGEK
ncbi:MAG TPA: metalloregulator ArsR/SmtB family transcription factor [bacterium]|nr:metalloregulator ArsR/SmtB family transcription factor [bacterium]